jgi:hypothetical protein
MDSSEGDKSNCSRTETFALAARKVRASTTFAPDNVACPLLLIIVLLELVTLISKRPRTIMAESERSASDDEAEKKPRAFGYCGPYHSCGLFVLKVTREAVAHQVI